MTNAGGRIIHQYDTFDFIAAELPQAAVDGNPHLTRGHDPEVSAPDVDISSVSTDSETTPWGLQRIEAPDAHMLSYRGTDVPVAVLDTGVGRNHPDLKPNIAGGHNVTTDDDTDWWDRHGHGTHCAGIIAASDTNDTGVTGVAPAANLYGVKVLGDDGSGYISDLVAGIDWCRQHDIPVLSLSWGIQQHVPELKHAVSEAYADGHILIAAAGNNGNNGDGVCDERNLTWPAIYQSTIGVGATTAEDSLASFSSVGDHLELLAPGRGITSTYKMAEYRQMSGTSMAAPHVAGVAAIHLQGKDTLVDPATRDEIRSTLHGTAEDIGVGCDAAGLVRADRQLFSF